MNDGNYPLKTRIKPSKLGLAVTGPGRGEEPL